MTRKLGLACACGLVGVFLLCSQVPAPAQTKGDAKQIQQLKNTIADRDQQIAKTKADFDAYKKKNPGATKLQKDLDKTNQSIKDKDALIASLQAKDPSKEITSLRQQLKDLNAMKKAPFVHTVILTLKKDDDAQVKRVYDEAGKTLAKIDGVRGIWIGKPAANGTPELAKNGYKIGVVVLLDSADALKTFLDDDLNKQFNDKMADYWDRPVVYDFLRDLEKKDDAK